MLTTTDAAAQTPLKELVTLAMLAATAMDERPSGEDTETHAARIAKGIIQQLNDPKLSTAGNWSLVWLALSRTNDNLIYVAQNQKANAIAVSIRGTLFSNLNDIAEDFNVGTVVGLKVNDSAQPVGVSAGAMEAFTEVMNAVSAPNSPQYPSTNLMTVLQALVRAASSPPVVYTTGHSLGGAIATVVGFYLQAQKWDGAQAPSFQVCTFAAPTAGVKSFADAFQRAFNGADSNSAVQIVNTYDVVPRAWSDLTYVMQNFFPTPGPAMDTGTQMMYLMAMGLTNGQSYTQACAQQTSCTPTYDALPGFTDPSTQNFTVQAGYQHSAGMYLKHVGAATLSLAPLVNLIDVATGPTLGGNVVNIWGFNFTEDCAVDFGTVAASNVQYKSPLHIQATAPAGFGLANVTVTNGIGTSATTPAAAYAFGGPEPVFGTLSASSGTSGTPLKITSGRGLKGATSVLFLFPGDELGAPPNLVPASNFNVISDTEIHFEAPALPADVTAPSNITVAITVGDIFAPSGSFQYTS